MCFRWAVGDRVERFVLHICPESIPHRPALPRAVAGSLSGFCALTVSHVTSHRRSEATCCLSPGASDPTPGAGRCYTEGASCVLLNKRWSVRWKGWVGRVGRHFRQKEERWANPRREAHPVCGSEQRSGGENGDGMPQAVDDLVRGRERKGRLCARTVPGT